MPMDVDAIVAKKELDELKDLITSVPRGKEREQLCDDIIEFHKEMIKKYKNKPKKKSSDDDMTIAGRNYFNNNF